jgi:serine/threonine protein kinase
MRHTISRMASSLQIGQTLLGRTGVPYHLREVLYERKGSEGIMHKLWLALYGPSNLTSISPQSATKSPLLTILSSNNETYVVKAVTPFLYDQAFKLQKELSFSPFVRLPVDGNDSYKALVFQHYTEDFLSFIQSGPTSRSQTKQILLGVLKGIAACHSRDWVHGGTVSPQSNSQLQKNSIVANKRRGGVDRHQT